jgi:putative transcriptional regulator
MLEKMMTGNEPRYWRMYTGMAGWAPGQLDAEINGTFPYQSYNGWLTYPGDRATIFRYDEEQQWEKALEQCTMQAIDSWF